MTHVEGGAGPDAGEVVGRGRAIGASEARHELLVRLGDALRPLLDPLEIQETACRLVAGHFGAMRTAYCDIEGEAGAETCMVLSEFVAGGPSMRGRHPLASYGRQVIARLRAGETCVSGDVASDPRLTSEERAAYAAARVAGFVIVPLVKGGRWVVAFNVHAAAPRAWAAADVALVEDVAERTRDAAERARTEAALRASEERYRMIVEGALDYAIFTSDPAGRITSWAPGAEAVFGWTEAEAVGQPMEMTYTPGDVAAGIPAEERALAREQGWSPNVRWHQRKDGKRVFIEGVARALHDATGGLIGFLKVGQDVTDRRAKDEALRDAYLDIERRVTERTAERDTARRQLAEAEESERRRLARELHDQLGQHLTAFALGVTEARRQLQVGELTDARLVQLEELARAMTHDARHLALELRPPELDDVGLESALRTYLAGWGARYAVAVDVEFTGDAAGHPLPPDVGTAIYRIVQEALTNVAKHAEARHVAVMLDRSDGEVRLVIEDDGRGFDPAATLARTRAERRLGLASMRERAALVGGTLDIESTPGSGTTLYVRVPPPGEEAGAPAG